MTKVMQPVSILLIAACLAVVVVFMLLGQYAHPSSDDFCMAAGVNRYGLFSYLWSHYFEWSGRYSSNALYAFFPVIFGLFEGYWLIPLILIAALFLAAVFFLSSVFHTRVYTRSVLLTSLCFVCVYLLGLLDPAGSLFWMAGALTYQTANILLLVILGLMFRIADRQKQSQTYFVFTALLLIAVFIAVGANETGMLAISAVAVAGVVIHLRSGWLILRPWLLTLVVALCCFAIVYLSPGNAVRAADFPLRHDIARALDGSLSVGMKVLWNWLSSPVLIVSSLLAPFAINRFNRIAGRTITVSNTGLFSLLLITFALPFVLQFPAWWAMGGWPPARTLDGIYFLFLLSWFSMIATISLRFIAMAEATAAKPSFDVLAAVAVVVLSLVFTLAVLKSPGMQQAKHDLFHAAGPWDDYMNQRYLQIQQAVVDGRNKLAVADFGQEYPRSLYFNDIMHNPLHWRNACYAEYFGLEKIKRDRGVSKLDLQQP